MFITVIEKHNLICILQLKGTILVSDYTNRVCNMLDATFNLVTCVRFAVICRTLIDGFVSEFVLELFQLRNLFQNGVKALSKVAFQKLGFLSKSSNY